MIKSLPHWNTIHALAVAHREFITLLFFMANVAVGLLLVVASLTFQYSVADYPKLAELGLHLGQFALGCYLLTLLPGILKRLRVFPLERTTLMLFRRQLGVLMFLSAYVHGAIISTIPLLFTTGFPPTTLSLVEQLGMFSVLLLLPLWLTSNDTSTAFLGKKWQWLHRLTYGALLLIFGHVVLVSHALFWQLLTGTVLILEVTSWIVEWRR